MAALLIKSEPKDLENVCRLCMCDENLADVFNEEALNELISDLLSIPITIYDRLSKAVCVMCRLQITEFHRFKIRCNEVQHVLKKQYDDNAYGTRNRLVASSDVEMKTGHNEEVCAVMGIKEETNESMETSVSLEHSACDQESIDRSTNGDERAGILYPIDIEENISIEDVKIETRADDDRSDETTAMVNEDCEDSEISQSANDSEQTIQVVAQVCDVCHKVCPSKMSLWYHKRAVHKPKNHACNLCGFQSALRGDLNRHLSSKQHLSNLQTIHQANSTKGKVAKSVKSNENDTVSHHSSVADREQAIAVKDEGSSPTETEEDDSDYSADVATAGKLEHSLLDSEKQQLQCDICEKVFPDWKKISNHKRVIHGPKRYSCSICEKPFAIRNVMERHKQTHQSIAERRKARSAAEATNNTITLFNCNICQKLFKQKRHLANHKTCVHGPKTFECDICGCKFALRFHFNAHMQRHTRHRDNTEDYNALHRMRQEESANNDKDADLKSEPIEQKPGVLSSRCTECNKEFKSQSSLLLHFKYVHKEKLQCNLCSVKFVTHIRLFKHMLAKHKQEDGSYQPMKCETCDRVFSTTSQLSQHMIMHRAKVFDCTQCSKSFYRSQHLKSHMRTHEDVCDDFMIPARNGFECEICHKVYQNRKQMRRHIRKEHGSELHECSVCSKLFRERSSLSRHMRTHSAECVTKQLDIAIKEESLQIDDGGNSVSEFPNSSGLADIGEDPTSDESETRAS